MAAPMRRTCIKLISRSPKLNLLSPKCHGLDNMRMKSTVHRGGKFAKLPLSAKVAIGSFAVGISYAVLNEVTTRGYLPSIPVISGGRTKKNYLQQNIKPTQVVENSSDKSPLNLTLFQFVTCPFCCKVRAMLDYYGINYNIVEVNAFLRSETKWTDYRKVPILVAEGEGKDGYVQMNDSSVIMSILESFIFDKTTPVEKILTFYPVQITKEGSKQVYEFENRYHIMYQGNDADKSLEEQKQERIWRKWVDEKFVHVISPNVYRTLSESYDTFQWFSKAGDWEKIFSAFTRWTVIYSGTVVMYFVGKRLTKKYELRSDVRASLYDYVNTFVKGLKGKDFMGGSDPNLADLSMYGVLTSIEGTAAFQDMMDNSNIGPWFSRTKEAVRSHRGAIRMKT